MDLTPKRDYVIMTTRMRDRSVWRRTMESRWPDDDLDAAREQAAHIVEMAKYYGRPDDVAEVFELCEPGAVEAAYRAGREDAARAVERFGEQLVCHECGPDVGGFIAAARGDLGRSTGREQGDNPEEQR